MIFYRAKKIGIFFKNLFFKKPTFTYYEFSKERQAEGFIILGNENLVKIGENVSFGGNVKLIANSEISIGDHTMVAMNVVMHTSTHNYNNHPMWIERIDKPINIGKHVWVGLGVIITPGVIIGDYSVIGAGSVVVSNVPNKAIIAGNPARILKFREISDDILKKTVEDYPLGSHITEVSFLNTQCKSK